MRIISITKEFSAFVKKSFRGILTIELSHFLMRKNKQCIEELFSSKKGIKERKKEHKRGALNSKCVPCRIGTGKGLAGM